jgi:hypothetical protein
MKCIESLLMGAALLRQKALTSFVSLGFRVDVDDMH